MILGVFRGQRRLEWWLAGYTVLWGLYMVCVPSAFAGRSYIVMALWAKPYVWGGLAAALGMFHLWALVINGRRCWSPFVRVVATIGNAAIFTVALAAVIAAITHGLAPVSMTVVLFFGFVSAAVVAFWIAGADGWHAFRDVRARYRARSGVP